MLLDRVHSLDWVAPSVEDVEHNFVDYSDYSLDIHMGAVGCLVAVAAAAAVPDMVVLVVAADIDRVCAVLASGSPENFPTPIFPVVCVGSGKVAAPAHQDYNNLTYIFTLLWNRNVYDDVKRNNIIPFQPPV